jgi:NTP pyrophosphatase (non-canonical NTP hydrolase)
MTTFSAYQTQAHTTSRNTQIGHSDTIAYAALGLAGEAGETANKIKKIYRDHAGRVTPEMKGDLIKELGGVLWYVAELATQLDLDLDAIAQINLAELASRQARGVITGNGDNR